MKINSDTGPLFDRWGNLTAEAMERYIDRALPHEVRSVIEQHMADSPFDREALEGLKSRQGINYNDEIRWLDEQIARKFSRGPQIPRKPAFSHYYWAAAAGLLILTGLTVFMVLQFRPSSKMEQGASNVEQPVATTQEEATALEKEAAGGQNSGTPEPATPESGTLEPGTPEPGTLEPGTPEPGTSILAGQPDTTKKEEEPIFLTVESMPEFPGGEDAFIRYVDSALTYPQYAIENGIQGRVFVTFVVEKDGSISNVQILRGIGGGCNESAVKLVQEMPKWKPGIQSGRPVRVKYNMPIKFTLEKK